MGPAEQHRAYWPGKLHMRFLADSALAPLVLPVPQRSPWSTSRLGDAMAFCVGPGSYMPGSVWRLNNGRPVRYLRQFPVIY